MCDSLNRFLLSHLLLSNVLCNLLLLLLVRLPQRLREPLPGGQLGGEEIEVRGVLS